MTFGLLENARNPLVSVSTGVFYSFLLQNSGYFMLNKAFRLQVFAINAFSNAFAQVQIDHHPAQQLKS